MSRTPTRLTAWEVIAKHLGLTSEQSTTVAASLGIATTTDATGAVFGDVKGSLLGPLLVGGIHGDELTVPALTADADDLDLGLAMADSLIWRIPFAGFSCSGFLAPETPGEVHVVVATSGGTLLDEDAGSTDINRILTGTGADLDLADDAAIVIVYDGTSNRWRVVGGAGFTFGGTGDMTAEAIASTVSAGSSGKASDAGHRHGMPSAAAPSGGYGTAAAGSAATLLRSDAVLAKPTAADVDFSADVTTNNVTTGHHGLAPKGDGNAAHFLDGTGAYSTPSGSGGSFHGCKAVSGVPTTVSPSTFTPANLSAADVFDSDNYHFTSGANLTGTVSKASGSATITGSGTSFTTELSVNQVVAVPGTAVELFVVKTITDDTHFTAWANAANTASGQTATRRNDCIAIPAGLAGYYAVSSNGEWDSNTTGERIATIWKNQAEVEGMWIREAGLTSGGQGQHLGGTPLHLSEGDIVQAAFWQTSGTNRTLGGNNRTSLSVFLIAT